MEKYYELLGISEDSTVDEIRAAYGAYVSKLRTDLEAESITAEEFLRGYQDAKEALNQATEARIARDAASDDLEDDDELFEDFDDEEEVEEENPKKKGHAVRNLLIGAGCVVLAGAISLGSLHLGWKLANKQALQRSNQQVVEQQSEDYLASTQAETETEEETVVEQTTEAPKATEAPAETQKATEAPTEATTEAPVETQKATEAPAETQKATEAPAETQKATEAPTEATTEAPVETQKATEAATQPTEGLAFFGVDDQVDLNNLPQKNETEVAEQAVEAPVNVAETTTEATKAEETATVAPAEDPNAKGTSEVLSESVEPVYYGDVMDENLVAERAAELVQQLNEAGIIDPVTEAPYRIDQIVDIIKFVNVVYTPENYEDVDKMFASSQNLLISQLNTDPYLYHCVFASGNDDFNSLLTVPVNVDFARALAEYGENGAYPLTRWMQEKKQQAFASTDREEIRELYMEFGQVVADIMKGNGCTITWEGKEYHVTSEQLLANHASALLFTIDTELMFANVPTPEVPNISWNVYNKFNSNGVDENGQPIIEPDNVPLIEIHEWVNNGCEEVMSIDSQFLFEGDTFGMRVQGDLENYARNNMEIGPKLTK